MILPRLLLPLAIAAILATGCKKNDDTPVAESPAPVTAAEPATPAGSEAAPAAAPTAAAPTMSTPAFDLGAIQVNDKPLGAFPYLLLPAGYSAENTETKDLARVPFWTGSGLEFVEGKVYQARIRPAEGKTYSRFEVLKRIDQALSALGAARVTTSKVPKDVLEQQLPEDFGVEFNAGSGGYYGDQEVSTYVLRRPDRTIWMKVYAGTNDGSLLIAESEPAPAATGSTAAAAP